MTRKTVRSLMWILLAAGSVVVTGVSVSSSVAKAGVAQAVDDGSYLSGARRWTSRDSVAMRNFGYEGVVPSPDGSNFFFTTMWGDLSCDCNVYELTVYSTKVVRDAIAKLRVNGATRVPAPPSPVCSVVKRSSMHYGLRFYGAHWAADGRSIEFRGAADDGSWQLFTLDLPSGRVTPLTHWPRGSRPPGGVGLGEVTKVADTVAASLYVPLPTPREQYPMHVITGPELRSLGVPGNEIVQKAEYVSYRDGTPWEIQSTVGLARPSLFISQDGKLMVALGMKKESPESWAGYDGVSTGPATGHSQNTHLLQFVLIDAEHTRELPILDAPVGTATKVGRERAASVPVQVLWAKDGFHAVLINAALPLTAGNSTEHARMAYIVGHDFSSGESQVLEPLQAADSRTGAVRKVSGAGWLEQGVRLLVLHEVSGKRVAGTVYRMKGGQWKGEIVGASVKLPQSPSPRPPSLSDGLTVTLRQGLNDPPRVVASYEGRELTLTAPDPALKEVRLTQEVPFTWHSPDGRAQTGGLLTPKEASQRPTPLVIQAYQYVADKFMPDGPDSQAYAGQAMAAQGIAVLNVTIPGLDERAGTLMEFPGFVDELDSAVDALKERGLIDPARVGVIGFSRAGTEVYYAITHPGKHPMAAAAVHDEFPATYSYSLALQAEFGDDMSVIFGGDFWTHKDTWLRYELTFNTDKVVTPTLFTIHGEDDVSVVAPPTIGSFTLLHRPFEYLAFPQGGHGLEMPRERVASQEVTADWMSFWLQGYEGPDPAKKDQYVRWEKLCDLQKAEPPPAAAFCVGTKH